MRRFLSSGLLAEPGKLVGETGRLQVVRARDWPPVVHGRGLVPENGEAGARPPAQLDACQCQSTTWGTTFPPGCLVTPSGLAADPRVDSGVIAIPPATARSSGASG